MMIWLLTLSLRVGASDFATCAAYLTFARLTPTYAEPARDRLAMFLRAELESLPAATCISPVEANWRSSVKTRGRVAARLRQLVDEEIGLGQTERGGSSILAGLNTRVFIHQVVRDQWTKLNRAEGTTNASLTLVPLFCLGFVSPSVAATMVALTTVLGYPERLFRQLSIGELVQNNLEFMRDKAPGLQRGQWYYTSRQFKVPTSVLGNLYVDRLEFADYPTHFYANTYPTRTARISGALLRPFLGRPEPNFSTVDVDELLIWRDDEPELTTYVRVKKID